ncbi:MAG TPA: CheR family methyltransferase [Pyrinomonadaceae bacterium]|nr:CheR family methyltransferase [Pyrinomonadaceae bacterium]
MSSKTPKGGDGDGHKRPARKSAPAKSGHDFIVVGLGASAGGITALERFFSATPPDPGMAFVVILHLSAEHESNLAAMLQRQTTLPVVQVTEAVRVERNRVYVIPPAKHLRMVDGRITLAEPEKQDGRSVPIDLFFRTLGESYREHAIGVVLSGTGTDGTLGLRRIKEQGGVSMAQDPREAEYDGMPRSAISDGMVDFVLPVGAMPGKLVDIRQASEMIRLPPEGDEPPQGAELTALRDILAALRARTGHDFSNYKQSTVLRRVTRRMQVNQVSTLRGYLHRLRQQPDELQELQQDLLISVTNFFRDAGAFQLLQRQVVPRLFEGKDDSDQVRVWATGCATGEEAYSLAILLAEYAEQLDRPPSIQIFATDIDDEAITHAREGLYPDTIAADVTPERLQRYFDRENHHYRVKKAIREMVLFAPHNILRDPPFSRLDVVSCRNLLIYLNRDTQDRVLEIFHFALRPGGFLFLGSSESADTLPELFSPVDKKLRVFRRSAVAPAVRAIPVMPVPGRWEPRQPPPPSARQRSYSYPELHQTLVEQFAPPSVLVNEAYDVVHVSERAGRYLQMAGGEPTRSLLHLLHPDLRLDVRAALYAASKERRETATRPVPLEGGREVRVIVRPVSRADIHAAFLLVIFDEGEAARPPNPGRAAAQEAPADAGAGEVVRRLEAELQQTRDILRSTIEQYETSTEELKASNEELQAINEELRSTTEELETSKEELQSLNEELQTVNYQLKDKVEEVTRVNDDLQNLLASTQIGTVFLDRQLRITRFTPALAEIFNVLPADVGRPLAHITHSLDYDEMAGEAERVLQTLVPVEREVQSAAGLWYSARILPYRTNDDRIQGVVVTFVDITDRKRAEERLRESEEQFRRAVEDAPIPVIMQAEDGEVLQISRTWTELTGYALADVPTFDAWLTRAYGEGADAVRRHVRDLFGGDRRALDVEFPIRTRDGSTRHWSFSASSPGALGDGRRFIVGMAVDVTERRRAEEEGHAADERLLPVINSIEDYAVFTLDLEGRITRWNTGAENVFGFTAREAVGQHTGIIFTPEDREAGGDAAEMRTALAEGCAEDERWHVRKDGSRFYASGVLRPLVEGGEATGFVKVARDLTEREQHDRERAELTTQLEVERGSLERRVEERTSALFAEVAERRAAEERIKELVSRIVETQEQERRRISRDLHDILGQQLTALRLNLEAIKEGCVEMDASLLVQVEQAQAVAGRLDSEVDFMAWELRPAALDEVGLAAALENFVHEWSEHFRTAADYHSAGLSKRRLAPDLETNLYRIAQEALNNVAKHAGAKRVGVILERRDNHIALIVEDDGRGFDPAEEMEGDRGMGLVNMRERASLAGGQLEIESAPGEGTTVFARVPARFAERR